MAELLTNTLPVDSEVSLDSFGPRKFAENDVTFAFFDRLLSYGVAPQKRQPENNDDNS